jgi:hypothetical protein
MIDSKLRAAHTGSCRSAELVIHVTGADVRLQASAREPPARDHITAPARCFADIKATPGSTVNTWAKHFMQLP